MTPRTSFIAAVVVLAAWNAAANQTASEKIVRDIPLGISASLFVDNPAGSIDVVGTDVPNVSLTAIKTVVAVDKTALQEGLDATQISIEGNPTTCLVRTVLPAVRTPRWGATVAYTLRLPRWVHIQIVSKSAERIHVVNMIGNVIVKGFNGTITLDGVSGSSIVDTTNGSVIYHYTGRPSANAQLSTVNGDIEVHLPSDANFDWLADTLRGDLLTTLSVRGRFEGSKFRASVNAPGGPTLTTQTILGRVYLLRNGTARKDGRSVRTGQVVPPPSGHSADPLLTVRRIPMVGSQFVYSGNIENIEVNEIRGMARVEMRAGAITLDKVWGDCTVTSLGGPLTLGDIIGNVFARTSAGDILVNAAREGGQIVTGGGSIRLLYTGGPTALTSGGGDIVVAQAAGPITAETRSGDITVTVDQNVKTERIEAHTVLGNVIVNLTPRFGAEIDATVFTNDADAPGVYTDFNGLTTKREQVGAKTKIHTTGKINGGGEKLLLFADGGDIHITNQASATISVTPP
jgi:DUF4097 and DUF4098 domain-containing protein YvlB